MRACERPGCRSSLQWSNSPSSPGSHCTGQAQPRKTESALGIATGRDLLLEIRLQNNQKGQRKTCQHPRRQSPQEPGRIVVVRSLSHVQLFATTWTAARQAPLSPTISLSLLRFMSIESVMLSNHLICHFLLLLLSVFPSIRVFSNESALCIRWPKYWSFSFSSFNEYLRFISFRVDWFYLLAVQETLKSLLQRHNSKASVLQRSDFFMDQLSRLLGKNILLTIWTFVGKVMSLLLNMLFEF